MKLLKKLEKSKSFWYLLGISLIFFLLRFPSLLEPNWYGDEGIYQVIGQAINNGRMLYSEIWDNKPPFLYLVYALFNGDQFQVRLFSMFIGIISTLAFYFLGSLLFQKTKARLISTFLFALLFASPILEGNIANAENFMILPVIIGAILIHTASLNNQKFNIPLLTSKRSILLIAGVMLGIAFLFKIVALFDFVSFSIFLIIINIPERFSFTLTRVKKFSITLKPILLPILAGFLLPVLITVIYFLMAGALPEFIRATFLSNINYVGWKNNFIFPQGLLMIKIILLCAVTVFLYLKRGRLTSPTLFIFLWFSYSIFSTYFSGRPYTHYALMSLSAFGLLIGLFIDTTKYRLKYLILLVIMFSTLFLNNTFKFNVNKSFEYYENNLDFLNKKKDVKSFQTFFDKKTPRDYEIASFIKSHTTKKDSIFIWGDSPQIYKISEKLPPGKYTVAYHITQYPFALQETQDALNKTKPKYIIILDESPEFPFNIPGFENRIALEEGVIYERSF